MIQQTRPPPQFEALGGGVEVSGSKLLTRSVGGGRSVVLTALSNLRYSYQHTQTTCANAHGLSADPAFLSLGRLEAQVTRR